jgi:hypothetical protein
MALLASKMEGLPGNPVWGSADRQVCRPLKKTEVVKMDENEFRCQRCGNEYPRFFRFGEECKWCFDEMHECCGAGGVRA